MSAKKSRPDKSFFKWCKDYSALGYDVYLTSLFGKDAIRMVKRYSYKSGSPVVCEQICEHESLLDLAKLHEILNFMYNNIQSQEKSGNYYRKL